MKFASSADISGISAYMQNYRSTDMFVHIVTQKTGKEVQHGERNRFA